MLKPNVIGVINNFYGASRQVISHVVFVVKAKFGGTFLSLYICKDLKIYVPTPNTTHTPADVRVVLKIM